jgi:hypothetical protein
MAEQRTRSAWRWLAWGVLVTVGCAAGCGSSGGGGGDDGPDGGPGHTPGMPGLGAHGLSYHKYQASSPSSISTPALATEPSGSTIIASIGRGDKSQFVLPTDNKGNSPYTQLGDIHNYVPYYPNSGTAVYAHTDAKGGSDFALTTTTPSSDEITITAVEVIEGSKVQAFEWNEVSLAPLTSNKVTTTGPATLIAFWWGDGFFSNPPMPQKATPNNGFTVVDTNAQEIGSFVQCAVAVKNVTAAGSYDVTWTATPAQGAQMWLIAVQ